MTAAEHLNPQQFVNVPIRTVGSWVSRDAQQGFGETQAFRMNATKRRTRGYSTIRDDIAQNGIRKPLSVAARYGPEPVLEDGHHRLAAAYELGMSHVPVTVHESLLPHLPPGAEFPGVHRERR